MFFAKVTRRLAAFGAAVMLALPVMAQQYPSKPIKIVLGFGPGGTTDSIARLYGQKMSEMLKTPVIVDNKPGGNQIAAIRSLQTSAPDGYTLYAATGSALVQNPALRKDLRNNMIGIFFQDNYKVKSNLTVTAGLRWR